jgi:hypothetical protein
MDAKDPMKAVLPALLAGLFSFLLGRIDGIRDRISGTPMIDVKGRAEEGVDSAACLL